MRAGSGWLKGVESSGKEREQSSQEEVSLEEDHGEVLESERKLGVR